MHKVDTRNLLKLQRSRKTRWIEHVNSQRWLLLTLLLSLAISLWKQLPRVVDPYVFIEDFRKFFWMHRFEDPSLFPDDLLISTSVKFVELGPLSLYIDITSPAYSLLFYLASKVFPVILFSKLLLFPLMMMSVYFLYRIGEKIRGGGTGFALAMAFVVLNLGSPSSISLTAGLQRSFFAPILLGLVYFLMLQKYTTALIVVFVGGLFYPPALVLGVIIYAFSMFEPADSRWRIQVIWNRVFPLIALAGIAALLLLPALALRLQSVTIPSFQQLDQFGSILRNSAYMSGGRYALFIEGLLPFVGRAGLITKPHNFWQTTTLAFLTLGLLLLRSHSWREFPKALKHMLAASFIAFGLAWMVAIATSSFALYLPSRYGRVSLGLVLLIFVVIHIETGMRTAIIRLRLLDDKLRWLIGCLLVISFLAVIYAIDRGQLGFLSTIQSSVLKLPFALSLCVFVGAAMLRLLESNFNQKAIVREINGLKRWYWLVIGMLTLFLGMVFIVRPATNGFIHVNPSNRSVLTYLQNLPNETRIMGEPCLVNDVPLIARRSVLWSCEIPRGQQRILDTLEAYYSESIFEVFRFCQRYDVDYLLVDKHSFSQDKMLSERIIFEPYNSMVSPEIFERSEFALQDIPETMKVYENDETFVTICRPPDNGGNANAADNDIKAPKIVWSSLSPKVASQDSLMKIDLALKNFGTTSEMYNLCLNVLGSEGNVVQSHCSPAPPQPNSDKQEFIYETYDLRLSPYLQSDIYTITVDVISRDSQPDDIVSFPIGDVELKALPRLFLEDEEQFADTREGSWGKKIALINYTISESTDETLEIELQWQALSRMTTSYKVFVHMVNSDTGELVRQMDAIPRDWTYPTNWWEKNEIVTDKLSLPLKCIASGHYQIWLGLYDNETMNRLPLDQAINSNRQNYANAIKIADLKR